MLIFGDNYIPYGNHCFEQDAFVGVFFLFSRFSPIPHLFLAIQVGLTNGRPFVLQEHACMRLFQLHLHRVLAHLARVHERIYVEVGSEKAVRLDGLFTVKVLARLLDLTFDPSFGRNSDVSSWNQLDYVFCLEGL